MSSFLNNPQMSALPRGAGALQQRPVNPQQPGPAETTRPPILNLPSPDTLRQLLRNDKSTPFCQFPDQAAREREKLKRQRSCMRGGRRQTLPWDDSLDLWDNSYNNVRGRWIEQGIWREEWDQVWVKEREAEEWLEGTFPRFRKPEASRSKPGCCWGHEDVGPGPDSAPELGPKPCPTFINFGIHLDASGPTELPRRPIEIMQKRLGSSPNYLVPYPTARSSEASRPYRQFLYQTGKEREWIKDEVDYQAPGADFDPDAMAYETVKYNWIEDGIWRPAWEELPGRTWLHEDPLEGEEAVKVPSDSGVWPSVLFDGGLWASNPERDAAFLGPATAAEVTQGKTTQLRIDGTPSPTPRGAETSAFGMQPGAKRAPSRQAIIIHNTHNRERAYRFPLGDSSLPQGGTWRGQYYLPAILGSQVPTQPPERHGETSGGEKRKLGRGQSDRHDEQPPKRPRYNPQHSVPPSQKLSDSAGTDKESLAPGDITAEGVQLARGETVGAASSPHRRSPGIAEGGGQQASDSAQAMAAKRGRPRRGD